MLQKKISAATEVGLDVVLCIGETAHERSEGVTKKVLQTQLRIGCDGLRPESLARVMIAYEPIWAISSNAGARNPNVDELREALLIIKTEIAEMFPYIDVDDVKILYGGSVKDTNVEEVCKQSHYDGIVIGGASLLPEMFGAILKKLEQGTAV
jgi:triosephosphate isomerase